MSDPWTGPAGSTDVPELPGKLILAVFVGVCALPVWFLSMGLEAGLAGDVPTASVVLWSGCWLVALGGFAALGAKILSTGLRSPGRSRRRRRET